jgi:bifunctional aspartokinase / homoserine dehydrogenase 1
MKLKTLTMKFGGTSVGDPAAIAQTVEIVRQASASQAQHVVVIVSAMSKVTDLLEKGLRCAAAGDEVAYRDIGAGLRGKHSDAAQRLLAEKAGDVLAEIDPLIDAYLRFCDSVHVLGEATPRALDYSMSLGERMSARLVAAAIRQAELAAEAVDATDLIVTDNNFQNASPLLDETRTKVQQGLDPLLKKGVIPVITGFIGATVDGISTTLGRGGSDYSAALIGTCLQSDEVWIWTDVDGVMSADPRVVPDATVIETLNYREVGELAYFGAKVLHPKTIRPVLESGIPLRVKNTFNPDHPGTLIVSNGQAAGRYIKAVTAIHEMSLVTVEGKGMLGVPGIAARTFGAVARTGTSVILISQSSSEQSICFVVPHKSAHTVVEAVNREFMLEISRRDIDQVFTLDHLAVITVVGAGMREIPGIAGKIFTATGDHGVNVIAITQGSSECSISMVVKAEDADSAVRAIHSLTLGT